MATLEQPATTPLHAQPITCTQPGGGLFVRLELAWGRGRRAYLRLFRRGYVRRQAALRLGDCPSCPHDIIDSRDLKYYRNVCGHYFREEEDPFHWRNQLGFARSGLAEVVCFSLLFLSVLVALLFAVNLFHPAFWGAVPVVLLLWGFILYFFRDPERTIPSDPLALVSPADGTVTDIGEVDEPDFPGGRAFRISIFLSVFNVHVNRVPRSAQVVALRYFPGKFVDARRADCGVINEQFWIDLEEHHPPRRLRVKQVAGAIARRIVCTLKPGEQVWVGDRLGMIKFGSRTDVLLPVSESVEVQVKVGDTVQGGSTVLLRFRESGGPPPTAPVAPEWLAR
jgi:phosphatidylserine decarboxylase